MKLLFVIVVQIGNFNHNIMYLFCAFILLLLLLLFGIMMHTPGMFKEKILMFGILQLMYKKRTVTHNLMFFICEIC